MDHADCFGPHNLRWIRLRIRELLEETPDNWREVALSMGKFQLTPFIKRGER